MPSVGRAPARRGTLTHLPRVEPVCLAGWEQEHVNELDQDAGGLSRGLCGVCQPLVDDHEDQVPKDAEHEQDLRDGDQVDVEILPKVPTREASEAAGGSVATAPWATSGLHVCLCELEWQICPQRKERQERARERATQNHTQTQVATESSFKLLVIF